MNQPNNSLWHWQTSSQGGYLTCDLLKQWQHGFFTSHFQGQPPEILVTYLNPQASVYRLKQIHSNIVLSTDVIDEHRASSNNLLEGDGIITEKPFQSVWAASADCTPVLMADAVTGRVSAIHSGWRGTASEVVKGAIALFLAQGSELENLLFALGPAIGGKVYQVDKEVAVKVLKTVIPSEFSPEIILEKALSLENDLVFPDDNPDKIRLNVTQVINLQIQQQGIDPRQSAIAPYCTYKTPEHFFSYRRTQEKNIQWSGIISGIN